MVLEAFNVCIFQNQHTYNISDRIIGTPTVCHSMMDMNDSDLCMHTNDKLRRLDNIEIIDIFSLENFFFFYDLEKDNVFKKWVYTATFYTVMTDMNLEKAILPDPLSSINVNNT